MALFKIDKKTMSLVKTTNFQIEKELQTLIENNLETVFNCRFVASEFSTGVEHAGRIDTLALSEDNNPVIIEYKKVKSSELINQSLYYLSWIQDHRGDFQLAVDKTLETGIEVDWNDIRVICLAPGYKKYDLLAVKMMGANIELWQYKLFDNNTLLLQEIFRRGIRYSSDTAFDDGKSPEFIEEGRMAAVTRATRQYTFDEHLENVEKKTLELIHDLREFIVGLDDSVEEEEILCRLQSHTKFCMYANKSEQGHIVLKTRPEGI